MATLSAVVMAAGEGTRMRSSTPKVLHAVCGRPLVGHVLAALADTGATRTVVVVGAGADAVQATLAGEHPSVAFALQPERRGTGDAAAIGLAALGRDGADRPAGDVLVLPGDTPLLTGATLAALVEHHRTTAAAATVLTAELPDPTGYGRVVRAADGAVARIVEHRDATEAERAVAEVNSSVYCFRLDLLAAALEGLTPDNDQGEHYLTDVVASLVAGGHRVEALVAADAAEVSGVNDRSQLADVEALLRARTNAAWMRAGVTMVDPARTYVDVTVELAPDVRLLPGVILEGRTRIARGCEVGPDSRLVDATLEEGASVTYAVVRSAVVGPGATVGPYTSLRAGTVLHDGAKAGSFVETKNAELMTGAKVPHLSYVGDARIGEGANLGAGTITANYDGTNKHRTDVGAHVHTGSNTVLVAPVVLGDHVTTGAGAVVVRDVAAGATVVGVPARLLPEKAPADPREAPSDGPEGA
jgi:bifunctional UDP-N-acetylglucosamine pyrophosphorylase / glucosamine-1-phosphate N-acetyltransferase